MSQKTEMMNCDDYRHALTADPEFGDESGHAESCASCRAYAGEIESLNRRIAQAMALDVPPLSMPELPDINTDNVSALAPRRSLSKPVWLAMAATVMLAAFIGIRMTDTVDSYGTLSDQVLAHVDHEPAALLPTSTPVAADRLERVVPADIATMNQISSLITYAESCRINGKEVPHLVIQGEYGPVTILLMPHEHVAEASTLEGKSIHGVILPVGDGSIAIVGAREEQLDNIQQNVLNSVAWGI